jgi:hypothetical protein
MIGKRLEAQPVVFHDERNVNERRCFPLVWREEVGQRKGRWEGERERERWWITVDGKGLADRRFLLPKTTTKQFPEDGSFK